MIDKRIVQSTMQQVNGLKYLYESQIEAVIGYVKHYINYNYNEEDLEESVKEGVKLYLNMIRTL